MSQEIKIKILAKKSDNKAFKGSDDSWYNLNDNVIPYLEKMSKGDEVLVVYEKKGVSRYVSKLISTIQEAPKTEARESATEFVCEDCGKALKDGKYKKCFVCNKKNPVVKEDTQSEEPKKTYTKTEYKSNYGSPEDVAGKEIGCSLGAASTVASGCGFSDPETAAQFVRELATNLLEWIRLQK